MAANGEERDNMAVYNVYEDPQLLFRHLTDEKPTHDPFYMHIHDQYEILYFIGGAASCTVETATYPLLPDTMILIRPMESHCITILAQEPYERYTINFSEELLDNIDPTHKLLAPFNDRPLGEQNVYCASDFTIHPQKLLSAMQTPDSTKGDRLTITAYLFALLHEINRAFTRKKSDPIPPPAKSLAVEAADYINVHLFDPLSVQTIAADLYVSVSQLNRQFKKATGFSPWDYIVGKRLVSARSLIRGGVPATHAYLQCGFNDYSAFYRLYLKRFGISPKADQADSER